MTAADHDTLDKEAADSEEGSLSVTNAAGKTWRTEGQIMLGDYNMKASTADVTMIPNDDWALV
jgi:hypothetical protein